jgi:membrane protease YdiL (CAAX protease family)
MVATELPAKAPSIDERPPLAAADWIVVVVAMLLPTAVTWLYFIALAKAEPTVQKAAYAVGKSVQFGLPIVWIWLVRRQRPRIAPPSSSGTALAAGFGLLVGAAMAALYFGLLQPAGIFVEPAKAVREKVTAFGADSPPAYLVLALFYSAIHSLLEEYYWRWFVFGQLRRGCQLPLAIGLSSAAFALHHVLVLAIYFGWSSPLTWLFSGGVAIGGAIWAWLYARTGSLYAPWLSHAVVDAAIFAIGYDLLAAT